MTEKDPFELFMQRVQKQEKKKSTQHQRANLVADDKSRKLIPMRKLLKRIQDTGLMVYHTERYADRNNHKPAERFEVFEGESSPSFLPGPSLYFDHPASVEIAIPNEWDEATQGIICIRCSTTHPESGLLHGPFRTMEDAQLALAEFLARSTVSMDTHPSS